MMVVLSNPSHCLSPHHRPLLEMIYNVPVAGGPHQGLDSASGSERVMVRPQTPVPSLKLPSNSYTLNS